MHDAETRALRHAVVVLLALSALRWGWSTVRPPAHIEGANVLPSLIAKSEARLPTGPTGKKRASKKARRAPSRARPARRARGRASSRAAPQRAAELVDVNHADQATLETLPGIGPALAQRILKAREEKPFASVEDLARVRGIGPATVKRLRGRVKVHR